MARTWGRIFVTGDDGTVTRKWVSVETAPNGDNSAIWITTLCQVLLLNLGESPFYANYGIPAQTSVMTQIFPDFYTYQTQSQFTQYFLSLSIQKAPGPNPVYNISAVTKSGAPIAVSFPI